MNTRPAVARWSVIVSAPVRGRGHGANATELSVARATYATCDDCAATTRAGMSAMRLGPARVTT
jgi:hypothetical protein